MTIDKAIKYLTRFDNGEYSCDAETFRKAVRLGNEALKRQKARRKLFSNDYYQPLPGETAE